MFRLSPCATTIGVPPSGDQFPEVARLRAVPVGSGREAVGEATARRGLGAAGAEKPGLVVGGGKGEDCMAEAAGAGAGIIGAGADGAACANPPPPTEAGGSQVFEFWVDPVAMRSEDPNGPSARRDVSEEQAASSAALAPARMRRETIKEDLARPSTLNTLEPITHTRTDPNDTGALDTGGVKTGFMMNVSLTGRAGNRLSLSTRNVCPRSSFGRT